MARIELENIKKKILQIGKRLDESVTQFLEPRAFVHEEGCENVVLQRETVQNGYVFTTTRSCGSCGVSDSFTVDHTNDPPPRFWG